ncbi:MAG: glycosyltransferase [Bacteroidota bacterium]|nr:glycosyltransferase [Bacteroidota bacterium]
MILFVVAIIFCLIYLIIQIGYLFSLFLYKKKNFVELDEYPKISILIAARNEASNIKTCLGAIENLDYDKNLIEVLIGNDQSTDETQAIIEAFIQNKPWFKLVNLKSTDNTQTKGKARVLATLGQLASGAYILVTDADIIVNPKWAKGLVSEMINNRVDMAGGTTNITADNLFEKFQQVDWLYFMGIIHVLDFFKKPITMVGNNMSFSMSAYQKVGGYETIPFSITEDYALFKALKEKGFLSSQVLNQETLVYSKPIETFVGIMKQRKRWLVGGWDLPLNYRIMLFVFSTWYFSLPILLLFNWQLALGLFVFKCFIQLFQILRIYQILNIRPEHWMAILFYDVYLFIMIPCTGIYFLWPSKTTWKGRKY